MKTSLKISLGILVGIAITYNLFFTQKVPENTMQSTPGYVNYSPEKLDPNKKNILFFHAQWCPACRTLEKDILSHHIPENVQILKTDFHSYPELKKKYGVLTQHTLVEVDADGNMLKKAIGAMTLSGSLEKFQN